MLSRPVLDVVLFCMLIILILLSLGFGPSLHEGHGMFSLWYEMWQGRQDGPNVAAIIMEQIRLPRTILAVLIGGTLGLSGATLQTLLRNPLADPAVLGLSGWASLGAVSVFYTGLSHYWPPLLPLAALAGAALAAILLFVLSRAGILALILTGAALGMVSMALLSLLLNLVPSPYASYEIMHWLMGSLTQAGVNEVMIAAPGLCLGGLLLLSTARGLDGLVLGEDVAWSLGISPISLRKRIIVGTALSVGSGVAVAGSIGFVGLVVPHLVRAMIGARPSASLLASALLGAIILLAADMLVRLPFHGPELQLGVVTALLGAPFFLWQIWHLPFHEMQE